VLFKAGDQVPVIPLFEMVGNGANVVPAQMAFTAENRGVIVPVTTVTSKVNGLAHELELGVKI
jgi:hypothetical protein